MERVWEKQLPEQLESKMFGLKNNLEPQFTTGQSKYSTFGCLWFQFVVTGHTNLCPKDNKPGKVT